MVKKLFSSLLIACAAVATPGASAQDFPSKTVRIIMPFAVGGTGDVLARLLAEKLGPMWKQTILVDNRPGAGGSLGADMAAKAPPDGYTLMVTDVSTVTSNPFLYKGAAQDFAPVSNLSRFWHILVAPSASPMQSITDLLKLDKAKASRLNVASSGNGTSNHLLLEKFMLMSKITMTHVPYKGAAPAITDVAGGQVDLMFTSEPMAQSLLAAGKIKVLAVTSPDKLANFPQAAAIDRSGVPGFQWASGHGLFAPPGTPLPILRKINADVATVMRLPEVVELYKKLGIEFVPGSVEEYGAAIAAEAASNKALIQTANVKID